MSNYFGRQRIVPHDCRFDPNMAYRHIINFHGLIQGIDDYLIDFYRSNSLNSLLSEEGLNQMRQLTKEYLNDKQ